MTTNSAEITWLMVKYVKWAVFTLVLADKLYVYIGLKGNIDIVNCCQIFDYQMVTLREQMCKMVTKQYH